ncbi:hypothetical protein [Bacillus thuringiensis]
MIICSATTAADLPKAKVMAESVKEHMPDSQVIICLVEKTMSPEAETCKFFDKVILAKDLGFQWPEFERVIFKYNSVEGVSVVKGQLLRDLLYLYNKEDYFLYLDPEMKVLGPLQEVINAFQYNSILLTPYQLYPSDIEREHELLNKGTFQNGFIAIKRSDNAIQFVEWFADRLNRHYEDPYKGEKLDQKFLNLAMAGFDVHVLKNPGYNVAIWNLHERKIHLTPHGEWRVLGRPLRIFNYTKLENWQTDNNHAYGLEESTWSYEFYESGEKISYDVKFKYRLNPDAYDSIGDLFAASNIEFRKLNT